jgi:uncharacterized OB-fold protein
VTTPTAHVGRTVAEDAMAGKCKSCGGAMNRHAFKCPHCGWEPWEAKVTKPGFIISAGFVILLLITAL